MREKLTDDVTEKRKKEKRKQIHFFEASIVSWRSKVNYPDRNIQYCTARVRHLLTSSLGCMIAENV